MYRFFSFAVLFNWLIVIAMLGLVGHGLSENQNGMINSLAQLLTADSPFGLSAAVARAVSVGAALAVLTAALWAIMAVLFADDSDQQNSEQDFVIGTSLGFCLILFGCVIALSVGVGQLQLGAMASMASLITVLAGVAQRVFAAEERSRSAKQDAAEERYALLQTPIQPLRTSKAAQSAKLASAGARSSRFIPKPQNHSYYSNP